MKAAEARAKPPEKPMVSDRRPTLGAILAPKSIALIGASEKPGSVGRALMENLRSFGGRFFPVNLNRSTVLEKKTFSKIAAVPNFVDLAVIGTPAATVPRIVEECVAAGVKGAVIISAGFKECGPAGAELEKQIQARRGQMRIIGPNCIGVMLPHIGLNATFAKPLALPGQYRVRQSKRRTLHGDSRLEHVEPARLQRLHFDRLDGGCGLGRFDYYLGDDPHTRSILLYMESVGDARAFLSAAREVALNETDHRDQGRPHRSGGESRSFAHWRAHWQRRRARRSFPKSRGFARGHNRRAIRSCGTSR